MKRILLLDYDYTLYPSTLPTLKAVDDRINLYIRTFLGLDEPAANATRLRLYMRHGTTLRGLEQEYGVDRGHYCDFVHAVEEAQLPPPDPALRDWLTRVPHPFYLFTNARRDWVVRGLTAMGLGGMLPDAPVAEIPAAPRLHGIFDIDFMNWEGKPHPPAYAKVDAHLRARHGDDIQVSFADDRPDNLQAARAHGWRTIWVVPHNVPLDIELGFDRSVPSLIRLDPDQLA